MVWRKNFTSYNDYFDGNQDEDALVYLFLANKMIHNSTGAITIAEEMSGMPGLASAGTGKDMVLISGYLWVFPIIG
jgi:hypothetical protein